MATKLKDTRELILNHVFERFRFEVERKRDLDAKANNLAGFVGIILSLVSGFGLTTLVSFTFPAFEWTIEYFHSIIPLVLFFSVYVFLFFSVYLVLKAVNIKQYVCVPNAFNLIGVFEDNHKYEEVSQALYDEYSLAIDENMKTNNKEATDIRLSVFCLFIALGLFSIAVILMLI